VDIVILTSWSWWIVSRANMILATLCYVQEDQRTLMMHRINKEGDIHRGKWNGLGGKFENGESPEDCVRREVREEAGIQVEALDMHGILTFPQFAEEQDWYVFVFTCEDFAGTPNEESSEGKLEWIPNEDLLELNLWEGDKHFLRWMTSSQFFSGTFCYEDGQLDSYDGHFYPVDSAFSE